MNSLNDELKSKIKQDLRNNKLEREREKAKILKSQIDEELRLKTENKKLDEMMEKRLKFIENNNNNNNNTANNFSYNNSIKPSLDHLLRTNKDWINTDCSKNYLLKQRESLLEGNVGSVVNRNSFTINKQLGNSNNILKEKIEEARSKLYILKSNYNKSCQINKELESEYSNLIEKVESKKQEETEYLQKLKKALKTQNTNTCNSMKDSLIKLKCETNFIDFNDKNSIYRESYTIIEDALKNGNKGVNNLILKEIRNSKSTIQNFENILKGCITLDNYEHNFEELNNIISDYYTKINFN